MADGDDTVITVTAENIARVLRDIGGFAGVETTPDGLDARDLDDELRANLGNAGATRDPRPFWARRAYQQPDPPPIGHPPTPVPQRPRRPQVGPGGNVADPKISLHVETVRKNQVGGQGQGQGQGVQGQAAQGGQGQEKGPRS